MNYAKFLSYYLLNMYLSLGNLRKKKSLWKISKCQELFSRFPNCSCVWSAQTKSGCITEIKYKQGTELGFELKVSLRKVWQAALIYRLWILLCKWQAQIHSSLAAWPETNQWN